MSKRGDEWVEFAAIVLKHVDEYTIPQYGDYPIDRSTGRDVDGLIEDIEKYCKRFGKNQRGDEEQLRDFLKIAHCACIAYFKYEKEVEERG